MESRGIQTGDKFCLMGGTAMPITAAEVVQAAAARPVTLSSVMEASEVMGQRYQILAYTGKAIAQWWSRVPLVIDLSASTISKVFPILQHHSSMLIIGHAESAVNEENRLLKLNGIVSVPSAASLEFVLAARAKFPWRASVGANTFAVKNIGANESVTVNGRTFKGPVDVVSVNFTETSILPLPADDETSVSLVGTRKET
ncbi:MAG: hypothetical protein FWF84_07425 [Kiritimatiellaeota bacterium]|nr:hypothetical protein [Kiritimatiellota bacterium]